MPVMAPRQYALVAYLHQDQYQDQAQGHGRPTQGHAVGEFVESLRAELHPQVPHFPAHLTILPPRCLQGSQADAQQIIENMCSRWDAFDVVLGDVETFAPVTPTVFVRVLEGSARMRELHDRLSVGVLAAQEPWIYTPHLTIAKMPTESDAMTALATARARWAAFTGPRRITIDQLTFVTENPQGPQPWLDLATVFLGHALAAERKS